MIEEALVDPEPQPGMRHPCRGLVAQNGEPRQIEQGYDDMGSSQPGEVAAVATGTDQRNGQGKRERATIKRPEIVQPQNGFEQKKIGREGPPDERPTFRAQPRQPQQQGQRAGIGQDHQRIGANLARHFDHGMGDAGESKRGETQALPSRIIPAEPGACFTRGQDQHQGGGDARQQSGHSQREERVAEHADPQMQQRIIKGRMRFVIGDDMQQERQVVMGRIGAIRLVQPQGLAADCPYAHGQSDEGDQPGDGPDEARGSHRSRP